MADNLITLYEELAYPYIEYVKNTFYEGSNILDIILKKRAMELKSSDQLSKPDIKLPTYTGYEKRIFIDNDVALSDDEATTEIWKNVRSEVTPYEHEVSGVTGKVLPANINLAVSITRTKLQLIEDLFKSGKDQELKRAINQDLAKYRADLKFGLAYAIYHGAGGDDPSFPDYNAFYSYPITLPNGSTIAKPSARQIEGIYSFVLNRNVTKLYGIDTSENKFYRPYFFDFTTVANYPFGYDAKFPSGIANASDLITDTNSMTAGVPVIIDILSQAISKMTLENKKPDLIVCRRDLFQLLVRAERAAQWSSTTEADKIEWLRKAGYDQQIVIEGVPIIPDDTKRQHKDGSYTYACPANAFIILDLSQVEFEAHKDYNFISTPWEKSPTVVGQYVKQFDATVRFSVANRHRQGLIQFGSINYEA